MKEKKKILVRKTFWVSVENAKSVAQKAKKEKVSESEIIRRLLTTINK